MVSFFSKINRFFKQLAAWYDKLDPYKNYDHADPYAPDTYATGKNKRPDGHIVAGNYGA
ncbi:hypothetical protein ATCVTN60342_023L [Acanthocystis turfacea Chlorella virus TN603.4.2]|nr:hypothetical protein ATCVTN60342_023L [Acanthocystis turfacea Chlorella virus TN603.4.2]